MKTKSKTITLQLTERQAGFLYLLLDGYICRESGGMAGTPRILRNVSQIGKRLSDAAGFRWRHNSK